MIFFHRLLFAISLHLYHAEQDLKANPSVLAEGLAGILFHQFGKCVFCFLIGLMDHRFHGYEFILVFKGFKFLSVLIEYGFSTGIGFLITDVNL